MSAILPLHLPDHLHTLFISTVGFSTIHHLVAPEFAKFLIGKKAWDALGTRDRIGWRVFFSFFILCAFVDDLGIAHLRVFFYLGSHACHLLFTR